MNTATLLWALTAALAGFLFGFDTAVIAGVEQDVQRKWVMADALHGLAISAALWGTVLGALIGGAPSDRFGRKPTLLIIGLLYLGSAVGSALAESPLAFILFRLLGGIGVGASSVVVPTYIAEIAPERARGRLVALFQTMIVVGILAAFLSNYLIDGGESDNWRIMLGIDNWRVMLGAEAIPAAIFLVAIFFIPESPRWLVLYRGDTQGGRNILLRIDPDRADRTVIEILSSPDSPMSWRQLFRAGLRRPIMLAVMLALFNQLSGINVVLYFAPRIFELAGSGAHTALLTTAGVGLVNLLFTLLALVLIDRVGRKILMIIGSLGYVASLSMVAYGFASEQFAPVPIFVFTFIASHAIGQGAVIWVYIAEIFPNAARARGQSLGASVHWVAAALLTLAAPTILTTISPMIIFSAFAGAMFLQLLFVAFVMVETREQPLEDVARTMRGSPI